MTQMDFSICLNLDLVESDGNDDLELSRTELNRLEQLVGGMYQELDMVEFLDFQIMSVFERDFVDRDGERVQELHGERLYLRDGGMLFHEELQCPVGPSALLNLGEGRVFASTGLFGVESLSHATIYLFRFVKLGEEPVEQVEDEDDELVD